MKVAEPEVKRPRVQSIVDERPKDPIENLIRRIMYAEGDLEISQ